MMLTNYIMIILVIHTRGFFFFNNFFDATHNLRNDDSRQLVRRCVRIFMTGDAHYIIRIGEGKCTYTVLVK